MNSLINAGISKVVYDSKYNAELSANIAKDAKIETKRYEGRSIDIILKDFDYLSYDYLIEGLKKEEKIKLIKKLTEDLSQDELKKIIK